MKKFLLYAGAVALSIVCFAIISAFKNKSIQDEGGHFVIVKSFPSVGFADPYLIVCYSQSKIETINLEREEDGSRKDILKHRSDNLWTFCNLFEKLRVEGYHLRTQSPLMQGYVETFVFEK